MGEMPLGALTDLATNQAAIRKQIEGELEMIEKLDLAGYFVIVRDVVRFCREHDIPVPDRAFRRQ